MSRPKASSVREPAGVGRLKHRAEFLKAARSGRKWVAPGLIVQARARHVDEMPDVGLSTRVGFTVSRKVGNAVARNRAKRRLRAVVDASLMEQGALGHDYVVIGRRATLERPFAELTKDFETALAKLGTGRPRGGS